jgi:hypothetical protein
MSPEVDWAAIHFPSGDQVMCEVFASSSDLSGAGTRTVP